MIAVLLWELKRRRTAIIWWTIGSVVVAAGILALYPSIRDQAKDLNQVINSLPAGLRQLKSGGTSSVNVADPAAFLNSQLFYATLPILWIIQAITRGSGLLGKEEDNRTLELLLARPLSRSRLLAAKATSLFIEFAIVGGATLLTIIVLAPAFGLHLGAGRLATASLYTSLFSLSFGLIALALSAASTVSRRFAAIAAVIISFGGYLIASLSGLTDWLHGPAKLAPFHYFTPLNVLQGQSVTGLNIYIAIVFVLTAVLAYVGFARRDIA